MSLSPDGAQVLLKTEATYVSNTWSEYDDQFLKTAALHPASKGGHTGIFQYELVDTVTGASQVLFDAPIPTDGSEMAWSPDSKSVVVSDVYLPLNVDDPAERALRKAHTFLVEFKIPSRQFVKISDEDLRLLNWDPKTGYVACDVGRIRKPQWKDYAESLLSKERCDMVAIHYPGTNRLLQSPCRISFSMRA